MFVFETPLASFIFSLSVSSSSYRIFRLDGIVLVEIKVLKFSRILVIDVFEFKFCPPIFLRVLESCNIFYYGGKGDTVPFDEDGRGIFKFETSSFPRACSMHLKAISVCLMKFFFSQSYLRRRWKKSYRLRLLYAFI